jgi:hypothetical protein
LELSVADLSVHTLAALIDINSHTGFP